MMISNVRIMTGTPLPPLIPNFSFEFGDERLLRVGI